MPAIAECKAGDVVRVTKPVKSSYAYEQHHPAEGTLGMVSEHHRLYSRLLDHVKQFLLAPESVVEPVSLEERNDLLRKLASSTTVPINACINRWHMGSDPEVFVVDGQGQVIPAFTFLPDKHGPLTVTSPGKDLDRGVKINAFWDGFQAEFTFSSAVCHAWIVDYIRHGLNLIYEQARQKHPEAELTYASVLDVPKEVMDASPYDGVILGCSPSQNVYGDKEHLLGLDPSALPFRFAGCHVHIGCRKVEESQLKTVVSTLDNISGVLSVACLRGMEDERRRKFYGLAGEYRTPQHGIEYRTLSSGILAHPALTHLFFDISRCAAGLAFDRLAPLWQGNEDETQDVVNNYDVDRAVEIVKRNEGLLRRMLGAIYNNNTVTNNALRLIYDGAAEWLDVENMTGNWRLGRKTVGRSENDGESWCLHSQAENCTMQALEL